MRLNKVPVPPVFPRPLDLYVLKSVRRIIAYMFCHPALAYGPQYPELENGARADLAYFGPLNYLDVFPWGYQPVERIRQFMKSKHSLRGGLYYARFDEFH